jgi:tetratricopeptide (TPR) repeat protein
MNHLPSDKTLLRKTSWLASSVLVTVSLIFANFAMAAGGGGGGGPPDLINKGETAYHKGDLDEAEKCFLQALKEAEKSEPNGLKAAEALTDLGVIYDQTLRFTEAESAYKRSLAIREKAYGPSDMAVATTVNDMANLYKDQKKYAEAEPMYKRAIDICLEKEGSNSPTLAPTYNNLAELYLSQQRYDDSIPLLKRCIAICEKDGQANEHLMDVIGKLGMVYDTTGKFAEAKPLFARYFELSAHVLGLKPEDPRTIIVLNDFAKDQRKRNNAKIAEFTEKAIEYHTKPPQ